MFLHVLAEEGGVGEAQMHADLLDGEVGLLQVVADVFQHMLANPFVGSLARMLLADGREVFGRDAQFVGVGFHRAVPYLAGIQHVEKALEMMKRG